MNAEAAPAPTLSATDALAALRPVARLAAVIARPLAGAPAGAVEAANLSADHATLAQNRHFRRPLNRLAARRLGFDRLAIGPAHAERLRTESKSQLALALLTAPTGELMRAAPLLAAAIVHRQALAVVRRGQRERLEGALGPQAATLAFREAPVLHAPLAQIDRSRIVDEITRDGVSASDGAAALIALGLAGFAAFVSHAEPDFQPLFEQRLDAPARERQRAGEIAPLADVHADHIRRLLLRIAPRWLASAT